MKLEDGTVFSLHKHDGQFYYKYNGFELMSTVYTHSEEMLAEIGCSNITDTAGASQSKPKVLIGGLGLGFTLKRTLELVGSSASVEVAELMPPLIEWNRTYLVEYNGPLLEDPRVQIIQGDLYDIVTATAKNSYDSILIDIDNTPDDLITEGNDRLYTTGFLQEMRTVLKGDGILSYWLAEPAPKFKKMLEKVGFVVEAHKAKPHVKSKRARHAIYTCKPR